MLAFCISSANLFKSEKSMLQLLKNAAPLSKEQHCKTYLETGLGYDFARDMSFVPVLANEVPSLVSRYSLAFLEREGKVALVALLGLKKNENLSSWPWALSWPTAFSTSGAARARPTRPAR